VETVGVGQSEFAVADLVDMMVRRDREEEEEGACIDV
jgi:LAO/AO transport system kinase